MKNLKKIIVSFLTVTLLLSVSAFAAPANVTDIKNKLVAAGLSDVYASEIVKYFAENGVTQEKAEEIRAAAKKVDTTVGSRTKASEFTPEEKQDLISDAIVLLNSVGLRANLKDNRETIVIKTLSGQTLNTISKAEAIEIALGFNVDALFDVLAEVEEDKKEESKGQVLGATEMKKTATNNGNLLIAGVAIMALAAVAYSVSRKKFSFN